MEAMKKIPYSVEIDVFNIHTRGCRYYQEKIYEYGDDGRVRFEWEQMRQNYIMGRDYSIEQICDNCSLNLLLEVEGCKGELYQFETFLRMLPNVKPDSLLLKKGALNSHFNEDETRLLVQEMEDLQEVCRNVSWPVAQVFVDDSPAVPAIVEETGKYENYVYAEWNGDDEDPYFASNQGYHVGITSEGIILKKNFAESLPHNFISLIRKGMRMTGRTADGNVVPIPMNKAVLPEWWLDYPGEDSELRFTSLPVSGIFQDVFNMIIVYGTTALSNYTGISVFSEFYRRA